MGKKSKRTRNPSVNPASYLSWDANVQRMSPLPRQNATVMAPTLPVEIAPDWTSSENSYIQEPTQPMTPIPTRNPNPSGDSPILLDAPTMQELVKQIKVGKRVGGDLYFHRDAISTLAPQMQSLLSSLIQQYAPNTPFDILKISPKALTLSLLSSPLFFESSYPAVQASQTVSFKQTPPTSTMARYDERTSPPIYHRTETFLPPQHPRYAELAGRTKRAEELGLYRGEMHKLGNQAAWDEWLAEQGFSEKDGSIVPLDEPYHPPLRRFSSSQPSGGVVMPGRERLPELPPGYSIEQELEKIEYAKTTSRKGKTADQALVPRVVAQMVPIGASILDFGSGKYQIHANRLREIGHDVTAHDFSDVNPDALNRQYDVVYASNVLNVQGSPTMLAYTLQQIYSLVKPGGVFVGNFPADPRPNPYNAQRLLQAISTYFGNPVQIIGGLVPQFGGGGKPSPVSKANAPVFIVQKRDDGDREENPSAESDARLHREVAAAMGRNPNPKSGRNKNPVGNASYFSKLGIPPEEIFYYIRPETEVLDERIDPSTLPLYRVNLSPNQMIDLNLRISPYFTRDSYSNLNEFPEEYEPYTDAWVTQDSPPGSFHSQTLIPGLQMMPRGKMMVPEGYKASELLISRRERRPSGALYIEAPDRGLGLLELPFTALGNSPQMVEALAKLPPPPEYRSLRDIVFASLLSNLSNDQTNTPERRALLDYTRHLSQLLKRGLMESYQKSRLLSLMEQRRQTTEDALSAYRRQSEEAMFDREFNPKRKKRRGKRKNKRRIPNALVSRAQINTEMKLPLDTMWVALEDSSMGDRLGINPPRPAFKNNQLERVFPRFSIETINVSGDDSGPYSFATEPYSVTPSDYPKIHIAPAFNLPPVRFPGQPGYVIPALRLHLLSKPSAFDWPEGAETFLPVPHIAGVAEGLVDDDSLFIDLATRSGYRDAFQMPIISGIQRIIEREPIRMRRFPHLLDRQEPIPDLLHDISDKVDLAWERDRQALLQLLNRRYTSLDNALPAFRRQLEEAIFDREFNPKRKKRRGKKKK